MVCVVLLLCGALHLTSNSVETKKLVLLFLALLDFFFFFERVTLGRKREEQKNETLLLENAMCRATLLSFIYFFHSSFLLSSFSLKKSENPKKIRHKGIQQGKVRAIKVRKRDRSGSTHFGGARRRKCWNRTIGVVLR